MQTQSAEPLESKFDSLLTELRREHFYGTLEAHYQDGRLVRVKKHETVIVKDMHNLKEQ